MPTFAIAAFVAAVAVTAMKERKWSRLERECRVPAEATVVSVRTDRVGFPLVRTTHRTYFAARTRMGPSTFVVDHPWRF